MTDTDWLAKAEHAKATNQPNLAELYRRRWIMDQPFGQVRLAIEEITKAFSRTYTQEDYALTNPILEEEEPREYTFSELVDRCYQQSKDKGFHDDEPTDPKALLAYQSMKIALMHSELSEALEELRSGHAVNDTYYNDDSHVPGKPEGVPSELADVVIRIMDFCGAFNIDLEDIIIEKHDYNATRAKMHGGRKF